ncbi:MAG: histidinol phosphate phosphatase domain-containing protein [Deltaproteobacteria bacterium]|nr:histidinol phosphate phosphatase domain-containing protein [Deltaproteobacteria bacterium]
MFDFHSHTTFSDGELIISELVRHAKFVGYTGIAVTDHGDHSNIDLVIPRIVKAAAKLSTGFDIIVIPGIELTHIPPIHIAELVKESRKLGAKIVLMHGEVITEPVCAGTNLAAINAGVDILAHPGLLSVKEAKLAAQKGIHIEITSRRGGCLTNGHVANLARKYSVPLIINSDTHAPSDLLSAEKYYQVALGAGLSPAEFKNVCKNAQSLAERVLK